MKNEKFEKNLNLKSSHLVLLALAIRRSPRTSVEAVWIRAVEKDAGCIPWQNEWQVRKRGTATCAKPTQESGWEEEKASLSSLIFEKRIYLLRSSPPSFSLQSPWIRLPLLNSSRALSYTVLIRTRFAVPGAVRQALFTEGVHSLSDRRIWPERWGVALPEQLLNLCDLVKPVSQRLTNSHSL